jgi:hypothetical protein
MKTASTPFSFRLIGIVQSTGAKSTAHAVAWAWARHWVFLLGLLACAAGLPAAAAAQQFAPSPALTFNSIVGGDNPLSQMITINSTGASFDFTVAASTNSGGAWLSITTTFPCCGNATPFPVSIAATPATTLAAGTYTGQIIATPKSASISPLTIPVTLIVHAATVASFDQIAGGLTFTLQTSATALPGQQLQIRNAGAGSLAWSGTTSTADGGAWLTLSAAGGTAPSNLTVSVVPAKLPGLGINPGAFTGQVLLKSSGDSATIPITVIVGDPVLRQINPLSFTKTFAGANPLNQVISVASSSTSINFSAAVQNSTGGSWLTLSSYGFGCCGSNTPTAVVLSVNPAATLAAGTYVAQVVVTLSDHSQSLSIPVSLTIDPDTSAYLDQAAGELSFSLATAGDAPPAQTLQIRNAGTGALSWTALAIASDGGNWLTVSAASGAAPADLSVSVNPANLPNGSLIAGTFTGQVLLQNAASHITVPVAVTVSDDSFRQINPLSFEMAYAGADPLSQVITIASTGTAFAFRASVVSSTGGNWLSITPSSYGCCGLTTPQTIAVNANPSVSLAAGTYTAEVLVQSAAGDQAEAIPVTLTVEPTPPGPFFDALPGQMSFAMVTSGSAPPAQVLPIRNGGTGTLDWTAVLTTSDGGEWLSISSEDGTAPSSPTVKVNPVNLPGGGLVAGTFTGQVVLQSDGQQVTIPVSMVVGSSVFRQVNPLEFDMTLGGANPLPQLVTIASTGTDFPFFASAISSTGGNWLSINPATYGCCGSSTPYAIIVTPNPAVTLGAGTYSSEIVVRSADGTKGLTIPVTLNIEAATATFFDSLPGQLTFSMAAGGVKPPAQPLEIRNAGAGPLAWTSTLTTSDGGAWLAISPATGTAPAVPSVSVVPAHLPGGGLTAGTFTGQVILQTAGNQVTIPVTFVVGAADFRQVNALDFNMAVGGGNPLPQLINAASIGTDFPFFASVVNTTGGNWLQINPSSYGCCGISTPRNLIVSVNPAATLAAGTYTAQIELRAASGSPSMVVPVTLTVNPATANFFDDMPGGVSFFQVTAGAAPAAQTVPIRNVGLGRLDWTASITTSDGGTWLALGATSGTAPSTLSISVKPASLPGQGLVAGIFNGQVLLKSGASRQTIPIQFVVGADVFEPVAPLKFTMLLNGSYPAYQVSNVSTTGASFGFLGLKATDNGANWLTITPATFGCCGIGTPEPVQVSVNPAAGVLAGSYVGEIVYNSSAGDQGMVVPVTLLINNGAVKTATPAFSPAAAAYSTPQMVAISDSSRGAAIYYTIDGTTPTTASKIYSVPLTVTPPETVEALAVAPGFAASNVGIAPYPQPITKTPTFNPGAGTYTSSESVAIMDATGGAVIYYTTDGTMPTTSSSQYTAAIPVTATETINAVAVAPGYSTSALATALYTIAPPPPVFAPPPATYQTKQPVTITDGTTNAVIYYTTNGTTPTASSTKYTGAITVSVTTTIEAIAIVPGGPASAVTTGTYTIAPPPPVFAPKAAAYATAQSVAITDTTKGAVIYYTTDGVTTPTASSTLYSGPITVSVTTTIKAIAIAPGLPASNVATGVFTIGPPPAPVFTPAPGSYANARNVTITDLTPTAVIYYTTDGVTTPTASSTKYTGPIPVSVTTTIKAIAIAPNVPSSPVSTATYSIGPITATPGITQVVTISETTPGATVYCTIDGTTPTTASPQYSAPFMIALNGSEVVKCIATAPKYQSSAVRTVTDTVQ